MKKKVQRGKNAKKHGANTAGKSHLKYSTKDGLKLKRPVPEGFEARPGRGGGVVWVSKKGYTGNPNGRPRKFVSTLAKEMGYTPLEVRDCISAILGASEIELKSIANNKHGSVLERTLAKVILKGAKAGTIGNLETIITRSFGYPNKSVDIKNTGDRPLATLNVTVVKETGTPGLSSNEDEVDTKRNKYGKEN